MIMRSCVQFVCVVLALVVTFSARVHAQGNKVEPLTGSAAMFDREISDPILMKFHEAGLVEGEGICKDFANRQKRKVARPTYAASCKSGDDSWRSRDCLSDWVSKQFTFAIVLQQADAALDNLEAILLSLIGTAEMRSAKVLLVCVGEQSFVDGMTKHVADAAAATEPLSTAHAPFYANVQVVGGTSAPVEWHAGAHSLMQFIQQYSHTPFYFVLTNHSVLPYTFRGYSFLTAFAGDSAGTLRWMGDAIRPLEHVNGTGVGYILGTMFPPGSVLPLGGWGPEQNQRPGVQLVQSVPRHSRWFLKEHFFALPHKERCKIFMFASNVCQKRARNAAPQQGYVWGCDDINPLMHFNPGAYFKINDCASRYVAEKVTAVVMDHHVPSAPSTFFLRSFMQSMQMMPELRHMRVLLILDGLDEVGSGRRADGVTIQQYQIYKQNIKSLIIKDPLFAKVQVKEMDTRVFQIGMMKAAREIVKTPFMFVMESDAPFVRPGDFYYLLRSMEENDAIKHARFNRRNNVPSAVEGGLDVFMANEKSFAPMLRSFGWSSASHLVRSDYYVDVPAFAAPRIKTGQGLDKPVGYYRTVLNRPPSIEDVLQAFLAKEYKNKTEAEMGHTHAAYGTYVYGYANEAPYVLHVDSGEGLGRIPTKYLEGF